jgi:release factor glutamine methyltransferase
MTGDAVTFEGLTIRYDDRVLRPRPWTAAQSRWAASLLRSLPPGPVLELCAGAGQIGLAAVAGTRRRLVLVDADPVATEYARANAAGASLADQVDVRTAELGDALATGEQFALVIADPPWVPRSRVGGFPEDPVTAIDGGPEGLDVARSCVCVVATHLAPRGTALLQLGSAEQATVLTREITGSGLRATEVRRYPRGVVVRLEHEVGSRC